VFFVFLGNYILLDRMFVIRKQPHAEALAFLLHQFIHKPRMRVGPLEYRCNSKPIRGLEGFQGPTYSWPGAGARNLQRSGEVTDAPGWGCPDDCGNENRN
jgi:hypothetical protein